MQKMLIWGTGHWANSLMPTTERLLEDLNIEILGFIDNDSNQIGKTYSGKPIYGPEEIYNLEFDIILIYAYAKNFEAIQAQLIEQMHIPSWKIGSINALIMEAQKYRREYLTKGQTRGAKIFDCFPFFNETEILHIRMDLLAPVVDHFVIVEMEQDHRGRRKPYNFLRNQEDFSQYKDKIIYVQPKNIPEYHGEGDWTLENFQRSSIVNGLEDAEPEDIICISDCDELINPDILKTLRKEENSCCQEPMTAVLKTNALALEQEYYCYYFNCRLRKKQNTSLIVKYKNMIDPQIIRRAKNYLPSVKNGGWHLTYFGGLDQVRLKVNSIVEGTPVTDDDILQRMEKGLDPYGREGEYFDADFLDKSKITIPNIDKLIEDYPHFYYKRN